MGCQCALESRWDNSDKPWGCPPYHLPAFDRSARELVPRTWVASAWHAALVCNGPHWGSVTEWVTMESLVVLLHLPSLDKTSSTRVVSCILACRSRIHSSTSSLHWV